MTERPILLGLGTRHRHDDAVGLDVAERLSSRLAPGVRVVLFEGEGTGLLELWAGASLAVLVDAVPSRGEPGRIHRLEGEFSERLAGPPTSSTHGLSVGEAWKLGESLGQLPERLVVYAVEGTEFSPGLGLSPAVARSVGPLVEAVAAEFAPERAQDHVTLRRPMPDA